MPLPVGVSVAMMKRSNARAARASAAHSSAVRRLPAVQICSAMSLSTMMRSKSASGIAVGPPLTWNETCGRIASRWSPVIAPEPGIEEPPVCTVVIMPCARAAATSGA